MSRVIQIQERDNVAVAVDVIAEGSRVTIGSQMITAIHEIPAGHKIALYDISAGQEIIKYGTCIGHASESIRQGDWVHTHNLKGARWGKK